MSDWQYVIIGSGNGLVPNRWQAIIWTNYGMVYWRINTSLGLKVLIESTRNTNKENVKKIYANLLIFSIEGPHCSGTQRQYHVVDHQSWIEPTAPPKLWPKPNPHGMETLWILVIEGIEQGEWNWQQLFRYKRTISWLPLISSHGTDSVRLVGMHVKLIWIFREPHWKSMGLLEISRITWQVVNS